MQTIYASFGCRDSLFAIPARWREIKYLAPYPIKVFVVSNDRLFKSDAHSECQFPRNNNPFVIANQNGALPSLKSSRIRAAQPFQIAPASMAACSSVYSDRSGP